MNSKRRSPRRRTTAVSALTGFALGVLLVASSTRSAASEQRTFASPGEASRALFVAVRNRDEEAIRGILGAMPTAAEKRDEEPLEREQFAKKYQEMHRLVRERDGHTMLYVGAENWPFPVPLVAQGNAWRFDAAAGEKEILFRRIGENELTAIEICRALAAGAHHGQAHQDDDFLDKLLTDASRRDATPPYRGYRFRVLNNGTKDFAAIAYPAAYRSSGVMTFIVGRQAVVYGKDLGNNSTDVANSMKGYRPDKSWKKEFDSEGR